MTAERRVTLRQAVPGDAEAIARLHIEVWEDAYRTLMPASVFEERRANAAERVERWRRGLSDSEVRTTVAEDSTGLLGFASVGPPRSADVNVGEELWALYVRSACWGSGVGRALLAAALGERPACLRVLRANTRAVAFYVKQGFVEDGAVQTDEYGTEIRMVREQPRSSPAPPA